MENKIININKKIKLIGGYVVPSISDKFIMNTIQSGLKQDMAQALGTDAETMFLAVITDGVDGDGLVFGNTAEDTFLRLDNHAFKGGAGNSTGTPAYLATDTASYIQLYADVDGSDLGFEPDVLYVGRTWDDGLETWAKLFSKTTGFSSEVNPIITWATFDNFHPFVPVIWSLAGSGSGIENYLFSRLFQGMRFTGNKNGINLTYVGGPDANTSRIVLKEAANYWTADTSAPDITKTGGGDGTKTYVTLQATWTNDTGAQVTITDVQLGKDTNLDASISAAGTLFASVSGLSELVNNAATLTINFTVTFL